MAQICNLQKIQNQGFHCNFHSAYRLSSHPLDMCLAMKGTDE